jgi:hypothetical protein
VYSGCGDGVHVWSPQGTLIGKIVTGGCVANFCWSKEGMWMFGEESCICANLGLRVLWWILSVSRMEVEGRHEDGDIRVEVDRSCSSCRYWCHQSWI